MKLIHSFTLISCIVLASCREHIELHNVWVKKPSFDTLSRSWPVGFAIGNMGYVGLGYTGTVKTDWWQYNPATSTWARKSDFPGTPRLQSFYTSDEYNGYVGLGHQDLFGRSLNDIWQYNAENDRWSPLTVTPFEAGSSRLSSFVLDDKLFITNGKGLWAFDLVTKSWQVKNKLPFTVLPFYFHHDNGKIVVISSIAYYIFNDSNPAKPYERSENFSIWKYDLKLDQWVSVVKSLSTSEIEWNATFNLSEEIYIARLGLDSWQSINILETVPTQRGASSLKIDQSNGGVAYAINNRGCVFISRGGEYWQYIP